MLQVTILSPHRDDAAFSLSIAMSRWRDLNINVQVVNFFTRSGYGPRAPVSEPAAISSLRKREDRRALHVLGERVKVRSCGLLDAPLRLGISSESVCRPESALFMSHGDFEAIASCISKRARPGLTLAPLALGDHVDHMEVRQAALEKCPPQKLGFYEDLPYAIWTPSMSFLQNVCKAEQSTRVKLKPAVIRCANAVPQKRRIISKYQSQITPREAEAIACFAKNYGGGERIWIPQHGGLWRSLIH
jgi:LmbE family N-acetylglucosaminyl deacetylase